MFCKYGDADRVKGDVETLNEILSRQGTSLLIDVIAEACGKTALKFDLNSEARRRLIEELPNELREAIAERV